MRGPGSAGEAVRLLAPQRNLIATGQNKRPAPRSTCLSSLHVGPRGEKHNPRNVKLLLPSRQSRGPGGSLPARQIADAVSRRQHALTVFDIKGVPSPRCERIEAAVVAGGKHTDRPHEAWIAEDPFKTGFAFSSRGRTALNAP
jgi:hypothetical protein